MTQRFKKSALFLCVTTLCFLVVLIVIYGPQIVSGQVNVRKKWNPRRVPVGTEFTGDQVCGECHKSASSPYPETGMSLAMERVPARQPTR